MLVFKTCVAYTSNPQPIGTENVNGSVIIKNNGTTADDIMYISTSEANLLPLDEPIGGLVDYPNAFCLKAGEVLVMDYVDDLDSLYTVGFGGTDVVFSVCSASA